MSTRHASAIAARLTFGPGSAADLMQFLGISQSTTSRALRGLERAQRVLRLGTTRGVRYALRRSIAGIGASWPLYRVDERGTPQELGILNALERDSYYIAAGPQRIQGLFQGVPYYLQDARPAGFLGRAVPAAYPELGLPSRVADWTDDHFLTYVTRRAGDSTGNLIIGTEALDRFLAAASAVVPVQDRATSYPMLAEAAMAGAPPGSSAQGEHPKFSACLAEQDRRTHVLVKFSPHRSTLTGQRWADLLTAEYVTHRLLEEHGIAACRSSLLEHDGRVFLECERFDRIAASGRRGVVSLFALDSALYGRLDSWTASAERLAADALLSREDLERIRLLDAFGALIANTDRHPGNVTLFDLYAGPFELAPVYDMLPMLFAPQDDQLVARRFEPAPARAAWLSVWTEAQALAEACWDRVARESRISAEFRQIASESRAALRAMPRRS